MLSTVLPQASTNGRSGFKDLQPGFKPSAVQGFGSSWVPEVDTAAAVNGHDQAADDASQGSGLSDRSNRSNNVSDRVQGSAAETKVDESVARLGPWAVEALKPGGPGEKQPLLRQVVGDIASGRHPVTQ
jgi:hypothetical protein